MENMKRPELIALAKRQNLKGYSKMKRQELLALLSQAPPIPPRPNAVPTASASAQKNKVVVNVYCNQARVDSVGEVERNNIGIPVSHFRGPIDLPPPPQSPPQAPQQAPPPPPTPVRKFPPVQTVRPTVAVQPERLSEKAQSLQEARQAELKNIPVSKVSSEFKKNLEALFSAPRN